MKLTGFHIGFDLYKWILQHIAPGSTILELGSGAGTGLLSYHYNMYSVEHDEDYLFQEDAIYIYAPLQNGWYGLHESWLPDAYDCLLIDGPPGTETRVNMLDHLDMFHLDVPIVIDDVNRPGERQLFDHLGHGRNKEMHHGAEKGFGVIVPWE